MTDAHKQTCADTHTHTHAGNGPTVQGSAGSRLRSADSVHLLAPASAQRAKGHTDLLWASVH